MKKILSILLCLTGIITTLNGQVLNWANGIEGPYPTSVLEVASGNVYVTGNFYGTTDFDPGSGVFNLTSVGDFDVCVVKLSPSGNFIWAKSFGGPDNDGPYDMAVDGAGNVFIVGWFGSTVDFDPSGSTFNLTSAGGRDNFICKLDPSGNFVWADRFGNALDDVATGITLDGSGNIIVTGYFDDTVDFDPGAGTNNMTANSWGSGSAAYILKLNSRGNFVWSKKFDGYAGPSIYCSAAGSTITTDASGNIYSAGTFTDSVDFDPSAGVYNLYNPLGAANIYISKLDASGNFVWVKGQMCTTIEAVNQITLDASGNIYTTGSFQGTADFDPGSAVYNLTSMGDNDIYISKLNSSGNFVWAKSFGSTVEDLGNSVVVDALGNVFTTGRFGGTVDFDPSSGTHNLTAIGFGDSYIQKLDASGNFVWANRFGSTESDEGFYVSLQGGSLFTTGNFFFTVDFDPGAGTVNLTNALGGSYILKFDQITGIEENMVNDNLYVSPNPTTENFTITFAETINKCELAIYNSIGENVYLEKINNESKKEIKVKNLSDGIYFVKVSDKENSYCKKLIIDHN